MAKEEIKNIKALTVRLPKDQARALEKVAEIDEMSVADAIRTAIDAHIETRRRDAGFAKRLHRSIDENRDILERLAR